MSRAAAWLAGREFPGERTIEVHAPDGGERLAEVALARAEDLRRALEAAEAARAAMAAESPGTRARRLDGLAAALAERAEEFALCIAREAGKPLLYARGEARRAVRTFQLAAAEARRPTTEELQLGERRGRLESFPIGVCSFITPFNFPLNLAAHKVAPALACGCPFVLKPDERTPLSALLLGRLLAAADPPLPPGSWSILPARPAECGPLSEDPRVRHLSFTGSAKVGWELKRRASHARVTLELGGNAAAILCEDADLEDALDRCVRGAYAYSGQVCISLQRLLVPESLREEVLDGLASRIAELRRGPVLDPHTEIGPMITEEAAQRVEAVLEDALRHGARRRCGGPREGAFFPPTLLDRVPLDHPAWREELFGPALLVATWTDFDQALEMVNDSRFGLQAALFTRDEQRIETAFRTLEVGQLVIGDSTVFRVDEMPYGGVKASGCGREGLRWACQSMREPRLLVLPPA